MYRSPSTNLPLDLAPSQKAIHPFTFTKYNNLPQATLLPSRRRGQKQSTTTKYSAVRFLDASINPVHYVHYGVLRMFIAYDVRGPPFGPSRVRYGYDTTSIVCLIDQRQPDRATSRSGGCLSVWSMEVCTCLPWVPYSCIHIWTDSYFVHHYYYIAILCSVLVLPHLTLPYLTLPTLPYLTGPDRT